MTVVGQPERTRTHGLSRAVLSLAARAALVALVVALVVVTAAPKAGRAAPYGHPAARRPALLARHGRARPALPSRARPALPSRARPAVVVRVAHCVLRDPTRSTFDYATGLYVPGRTLDVEVRYRVAPPTGSGLPGRARVRPRPAVLFAPGYDNDPDGYGELLDAWARAGLVVVGVSFPDTNPAAVAAARYGDPEDDLVNQPADMAFLERSVAEAADATTAACPVLRGLVDPRALALAGQSDGGATVAMLAYDQQYAWLAPKGDGDDGADAGPDVRAALVMSGNEVGPGPYEATVGDPALLVVQSATDHCNPPQASVAIYDAVVQRDRWFLDVHDADHLGPYDGADPAAFAVVARVTTRFLLLELRGAVPAAGFVAYANASPTVATLTTGPSAPAMPVLEQSPAAC